MAGREGGRVVVGVHVLAGPLGLDICRCEEEGEVKVRGKVVLW